MLNYVQGILISVDIMCYAASSIPVSDEDV